VSLFSAMLLLRLSVPGDPTNPAAWQAINPRRVELALNLIPVAGVAFLWFIGVLRDRPGAAEDRFFSTLFLGSGLLFLAMLFTAGAVLGAILITYSTAAAQPGEVQALGLSRALLSNLTNIYAIKMAAVFMITTSTLVLRTALAPRWIAFLGYLLSLPLLFGSRFLDWEFVVFPLWVLLFSGYILADNLYRIPNGAPEA
jgi:hypothetical protein